MGGSLRSRCTSTTRSSEMSEMKSCSIGLIALTLVVAHVARAAPIEPADTIVAETDLLESSSNSSGVSVSVTVKAPAKDGGKAMTAILAKPMTIMDTTTKVLTTPVLKTEEFSVASTKDEFDEGAEMRSKKKIESVAAHKDFDGEVVTGWQNVKVHTSVNTKHNAIYLQAFANLVKDKLLDYDERDFAAVGNMLVSMAQAKGRPLNNYLNVLQLSQYNSPGGLDSYTLKHIMKSMETSTGLVAVTSGKAGIDASKLGLAGANPEMDLHHLEVRSGEFLREASKVNKGKVSVIKQAEQKAKKVAATLGDDDLEALKKWNGTEVEDADMMGTGIETSVGNHLSSEEVKTKLIGLGNKAAKHAASNSAQEAHDMSTIWDVAYAACHAWWSGKDECKKAADEATEEQKDVTVQVADVKTEISMAIDAVEFQNNINAIAIEIAQTLGVEPSQVSLELEDDEDSE